jgi:hypothetical protein
MNFASNMANIARSEGDPKVLSTGPSSLTEADRLGRALGWFSLGLGLIEILAPRTVTRTIGMEGHEGLVRAYGAREIGAGVLSLSTERSLGLWSRVAGDALDIATVVAVGGRNDRKRGAAALTLVVLAGVAAIDFLAAQAVTAKHSRSAGSPRSYKDRSGYPRGLEAARGAARRRRVGDVRPEATSFKMTEHSAAQ